MNEINMYQRKSIATRSRRAPARKAAREQLATVNLCSRRLIASDQAQAEDADAAFVLGELDYEDGLPCDPHSVTGSPLTRQSYITGYNTARRGVGSLTDAEIEAEAEDYTDDILDRADWSRGGW